MATFRLLRQNHRLNTRQDGRTGTKVFIDTGGALDEPAIGDVFDDTEENELLTAREIDEVPYGNDGSNDLFKFTVQYSDAPTEDSDDDEETDSGELSNNGDMASEWLELTSGTTGHSWTWQGSGDVITNKKIRRRVILQSLRITQTRGELDFAFWRTKLNKLNNVEYRKIQAEGWLFTGGSWREIRNKAGQRRYRFDLLFLMKQIAGPNNGLEPKDTDTYFGWNHVYRPDAPDEFLRPLDSSQNTIYAPTVFEGPTGIFG